MLKYNNKDICKVYKNEDIVKKIYKAGSKVFEYKNANLPQDYQECKYIQTTGTEYIKTDFIPNDYNGNYTVMIDFQGISLISSNAYICGCGGDRSCNIRIQTTGTVAVYNENMSSSGASIVVSLSAEEADILNRHKCKIILKDQNPTTLIKNGVEYSEGNNSGTSSLSRFNIGRSSGINYPMKIYSCKLYDENNNLVRNFVPCLDNNYIPCMYEYITQQTFYNAGTGTFIYELI